MEQGLLRRASLFKPTVVAFILTCAVYSILAIHSFHDKIFLLEIASNNPPPALVIGTRTVVSMLILCGLLLEFYRRGFYSLLTDQVPAPMLFIAISIVTLLTFATAPFDSEDFAMYINHGWLQTHYKANPYITTVAEIPRWREDFMLRPNWSTVPSVYGPVFLLITRIVTGIAGENYGLTVWLLKGLCAAMHISIAYMLWKGVGMLASPAKAMQAAYLYAFNPLVLLQELANGHNDIFVAFFTCLAIFLYLNKKYSYVMLSCFLGGGIKYVSLVIVPFLFVLLARTTDWRRALRILLVGIIPVAAIFVFYLAPLDVQHARLCLARYGEMEGNFQSLVHFLPLPNPLLAFRIGTVSFFIFLASRLFIAQLKQPFASQENSLLQKTIYAGVILQALAACLLTNFFNSWYLCMFFPLALFLVEDTALKKFCIAATSFMVFSLLWMGGEDAVYCSILLWLAFIVSRCGCCTNSDVGTIQC